MPPNTLLADPAVRFAGVRFGVREVRGRRIAVRRRLSPSTLALAAVFAIAVGGVGYLHTWPPLATVMSGSMEPTIKTGDMVLLKKLDGAPRIGDIVAVTVPAEVRSRFGYPPVVIHRIIAIDSDGIVTTKGDAFKKKDPFSVPSSALSTKVVATVPAAGRVFAFLSSTLGLMWLAGGAIMLIGMPLLDRYREGQRRGLDERDDVRALLQSVTEELVAAARRPASRSASSCSSSSPVTDRTRQIETAIARDRRGRRPPPPPPLPRGPRGCVPASQWKPPTPDVMAMLRPAKTPSEIFRLPVDFVPALTR